MANVQISAELFKEIYSYFAENDPHSDIMKQLDVKLNKLCEHELFSKYKRAATPQERERYRNEYLDIRGVPNSFRTETEIPKEEI